MTAKVFDLVDDIIAWESGEIPPYSDEEVALFDHLVATGMAWQLQGTYGRRAQQLIDEGYVTPIEYDSQGVAHDRSL